MTWTTDDYSSLIRHDPVVNLQEMSDHFGTNWSMRGSRGWGIWAQTSVTCRHCSRSSTLGPENTSFHSGCWLQRLCRHLNHQATETRGSLRTNTAASNQVTVRDCWAKQQLAVDQVRGPPPGLRNNITLRREEASGRSDVTDVPSRGLVGSSSKHRWRIGPQ